MLSQRGSSLSAFSSVNMEGGGISGGGNDIFIEDFWEEKHHLKEEPEEIVFCGQIESKDKHNDGKFSREQRKIVAGRSRTLREAVTSNGENGGVRAGSTEQKRIFVRRQNCTITSLVDPNDPDDPGSKSLDDDDSGLQIVHEGSTGASRLKKRATTKENKVDGESAKRLRQLTFPLNDLSAGNPSAEVSSKGPRYPRRLRKQTDYSEDGPDADEFIHCDDCDRDYEGDCPVHGAFFIVEDTPIALDINDKFRAKKTAPSQVVVADSKIPSAGSGVWAREVIPARTRFGPYEGVIVPPRTCSAYSWLIRKNGRAAHCVDASELGLSNWMRFVNCARHDGEQNLDAFQYKGKIYYKTLRRVTPHEELLVWYGDEYGRQLGIDPEFCDAEDEEKWKVVEELKSNCQAPEGGPKSAVLPADKKLLGKKLDQNENTIKSTCVSADSPKRRKRLFADGEYRRSGEVGFHHGTSPGHMMSNKNPFVCEVCCERLPDDGTLAVHLRTHSDQKGFVCGICSKKFLRRSDFNRHERTHSGERPFACDQCHERFCQKAHLKRHKLIHTGEKPYGCPVCDKRFVSKKVFDKHVLTHISETPFACHACHETFHDEESVANHVETHKKMKRFACPECNKQFAENYYLNKHMQTHNVEKPFACGECNERFSLRWHLTRHMRKHSGEKPFCCSECCKQFSRKDDLKAHVRLHTGEKPFSCAECGERFSHKQHLKRHQRTHSGEKPFACSQCNKQFADRGPLKIHLLTHRRLSMI